MTTYIFSFTCSEDGITYSPDCKLTFPGGNVPYVPQPGDTVFYPSKNGTLALQAEVQERPEVTYQVREPESDDVKFVILTFKLKFMRAVG
jgi:hypothetical protein